ncbi:MAG: PQQ-binding-like beta-propeller repeat protein [Sedimentisphaerales bacterium]|nr:PQQ-binding-like beta-propeller repeat protein [Sedimentisphaerales bacterium]
MRFSKVIFLSVAAAILLVGALVCEGAGIVEKVGLARGICVLPGDGECRLALELARETDLLLYVQLEKAEDVEVARRAADDAGLYGSRIFVEQGPLAELHLADNIADVLVPGAEGVRITRAEALRVLRPQGRAFIEGKTAVKALPEGIDDWSHPYHGPDNNPQSEDKVIVGPYLTQFMAEPRYAPLPQVAVASAGRVFKAFGHVAFKQREEALLNKLVAYNGYNGTELWRRDLREGVMIHRNTMIAMPERLYVGDDLSCKVIDTATGKLIDEIIPAEDVAGGTFWKWMALEDGVLYAVIGDQEQRDPTKRWKRDAHGWPWDPISEGFNQPENPWGYGRTVLAIDPKSKKVLWSHREDKPIDCRAVCMKHGRIYVFRHGVYLACLDAKDGEDIWRKTPENAPALFRSLGEYLNRQDWRTNWRTTCYLKCSDEALYFAGPQIGRLLVVSAKDGGILWQHPYSNFQLVIQDGVVYGLSGQIDKHPSMKFGALTGEVLAEIDKARRACTRPSGCRDAIFFRAEGGSVRLDLASNRPGWISPMRAQCQDGVTIANGLLYWWPSVCDCQLTLYGITTLAPAGNFDFEAKATEAERLENSSAGPVAELSQSEADWPTFRADNQCTARSEAAVGPNAKQLWQYDPKISAPSGAPRPTAPVAAGGLVFVSGPDGIVRAVDAKTGKLRWKAYTGGAVRIPPTIWNGRAFVGSGDGYAYCFEAKTGRLLWRFRAAPAERWIPVYGSLMSTWPAASGVLVEDGTAYVAAGIVNYDGTYVYALDAETGKIKWQNNTSGHLDKQARTGASVQGHQLLYDGKLYLASGTSLSPAVYNVADGKCINDPAPLATTTSRSPRGWELSLLGGQVVACGRPLYALPGAGVFDATVFGKVFLASAGERDVVWAADQSNKKILCYNRINPEAFRGKVNNFQLNWGGIGIKDKPVWAYDCGDSEALAVCNNAVVLAGKTRVAAVNLGDGAVLWSEPLPGPAVTWGLAVDRDGRVIVTLEDGKVVCLGQG